MNPLEINLDITPTSRFQLIDVSARVREEVGDRLEEFRKVLYCSFHTTAGYLEQGASARIGNSRKQLDPFFRMDLPPVRKGKADAPGYDEILSRFHNPLEMPELFKAAGLYNHESTKRNEKTVVKRCTGAAPIPDSSYPDPDLCSPPTFQSVSSP